MRNRVWADSAPEYLPRERPAHRSAVNAYKERKFEEVRAYRLRAPRAASHLTQVELAERLDVSQNRASRIERGDIARAPVDALRTCIEGLGGTLRVEVEYAYERIQIA